MYLQVRTAKFKLEIPYGSAEESLASSVRKFLKYLSVATPLFAAYDSIIKS